VPLLVDVAPFGVAPPPLPEPEPDPDVPPPLVPPPLVPPPVVPPLVPPPLVPPPLVPPPLVPPEVPDDEFPLPLPEAPDDELAPPAEADVEGAAPLDVEVPVVLVVEVVEVVFALAGEALIVCVGTVNGGAPEVSVVADPPPQAASAAQTPTPAATVAMRPQGRAFSTAVRWDTTDTSDVERLHAPSAVRAVVEVLLAKLVTPVTESKVLDGPGQLGPSGGERQQLGDHLERLAGLPVDVRLAGLGIDHDLPPGGWRPHPVPLTRPHSRHRIAGLGCPRRRGGPRQRPCGAVSLGADSLDRVPPVEVWSSRWDASPR
jgi:hypothetical protein